MYYEGASSSDVDRRRYRGEEMPIQTMLIQARNDKGWNQTQAAEVVGIDKTYLNHIEAGRKVPSPGIIARIAEKYGMDLAVLMKELLAK